MLATIGPANNKSPKVEPDFGGSFLAAPTSIHIQFYRSIAAATPKIWQALNWFQPWIGVVLNLLRKIVVEVTPCGRALRRLSKLPEVVVATNPYALPADPLAAWDLCDVLLSSRSNSLVGSASYGLAHRLEQIYLFNLEIDRHCRRCGYATAFLWALHRTHLLPIRPIHIIGSARAFWDRAEGLRLAGVMILPELRCSELYGPASA